jgi:pyruvate/2-oxoglutarate dehydrogenase complex dihydrolipoamide dehydrogenase (E3) component
LDESEHLDDIEFDYSNRIKVDYNMRTEHKRVFAAGDVSSVDYFLFSGEKMPCDNWTIAHNEGIIAAYNVLGLV